MYEKVNMYHPDKVADRIAGAMVDLAYSKQENPRVAVEVLIGHDNCHIIAESSYNFTDDEVQAIVDRIAGNDIKLDLLTVKQDKHLANNQDGKLRCGDNGIFKGVPTSEEENKLAALSQILEDKFKSDGKYIINNNDLIICQSKATNDEIKTITGEAIINPLGYWTGGTNVDTGATNRKLGSDMGRAVTGGGLHRDIAIYDKPSRSSEHPTSKPVAMIGKLINNSSKPNEIVLDTFGGSGSTLIACEELDRKCYTMELDPHYCDVILARWEKMTGQTAQKVK